MSTPRRDEIEDAKAQLSDAMDMLKAATGLNSRQVLVEGKLPDDAVISLDAADIYRLYDLLHDAYVAVCFARGPLPFRIVATMKAGDPDSIMPTSLLPEAEAILRQGDDDAT
jgi:hypothetical protein